MFHDDHAPGFEMSKHKKGASAWTHVLKMDTLHFAAPGLSVRADARLWPRTMATAMLLACMRAPISLIRRHPFAIT